MGNTIDSRSQLASVIVPCWNQLEFTRQCMAALMRCTRSPWELIVVNNGSTDGTSDYLAGVQDASPVPVTVIANSTNLGFPAAINQGLKCARGEYLVLLNNDAVVTGGWLEQLIGLTTTRTGGENGLAGSAAVSAETTTPEHPFACGLRASDSAGTSPVGAAPGIGASGSAETSPPGSARGIEASGSAETTPPGRPSPPTSCGDLSPRGRGGGEACLGRVSRGIGLVGPMTNYAAPPQLIEDVPYRGLDEMRAFAERWREEHRGQWFTVPKLSGFCLLMKLAVYEAIGGLDEQFGLGFFDDDDLAIRARRAGFELAVAHDLFIHHFGSRTFAGNGVNTERLLSENEQRFSAKWGQAAARGRRVTLRPFISLDARSSHLRSSAKSADGIRLSGDDIRAIGPSTETRRAKVSLTMIVSNEQENLPHCFGSVAGLFDEIVVVDAGSTDRTREIAREFGARVFDFVWVDDFAAARNAALARATGDYAFWLDADDVIDPPQRVRLEQLLADLRPGEPAAHVVKCACDPGPDGAGGDTVPITRKLYALIARSHQMLAEPQEALAACAAGLAVDPDDAEPIFREAVVRRQTGDNDGAERCWRRILTLKRPEQFASVDQGIYGHLTRRNLAALAKERGDHSEAANLWRAVLAECPNDREARAHLGEFEPLTN